jgi:hypothetical protein
VRRLAALVSRRAVAARITRRIIDLVDREPDFRFENPADVSLLVYEWLLVRANSSFSRLACSAVLQVHNLWWSERFARLYLTGKLEKNDAPIYTDVPGTVIAGSGEVVTTGSMTKGVAAAALIAAVSIAGVAEPNTTTQMDSVYGTTLGETGVPAILSAHTSTTMESRTR